MAKLCELKVTNKKNATVVVANRILAAKERKVPVGFNTITQVKDALSAERNNIIKIEDLVPESVVKLLPEDYRKGLKKTKESVDSDDIKVPEEDVDSNAHAGKKIDDGNASSQLTEDTSKQLPEDDGQADPGGYKKDGTKKVEEGDYDQNTSHKLPEDDGQADPGGYKKDGTKENDEDGDEIITPSSDKFPEDDGNPDSQLERHEDMLLTRTAVIDMTIKQMKAYMKDNNIVFENSSKWNSDQLTNALLKHLGFDELEEDEKSK